MAGSRPDRIALRSQPASRRTTAAASATLSGSPAW
jgi:hypothetical protein